MNAHSPPAFASGLNRPRALLAHDGERHRCQSGDCLARKKRYLDERQKNGASECRAGGYAMIDMLKAYGLKVIESLYRASVASVLAFCALVFLMAIIAMALHLRAIDVHQFHPVP